MKTVEIGAGVVTSRLGFGAAVLTGGPSQGNSLRLLGAAFEAGIRHFDVAPAYGLGLAEDVLGAFIQDRRNEVTVTTKIGLARPPAPAAMATLRAAARPLLAFAPALRQRVGRAAYRISTGQARFDVGRLQASFAESLRRLRTDHVEILLLHELSVADVSDELLRLLEDLTRQGRVGAWGIGSSRVEAEPLTQAFPELTRIVQTNWSAGDPSLTLPDANLVITHGSLRRLSEMSAWLTAHRARLERFSAEVGADLASPATRADLLLAAALARDSAGIVLAASSRRERIVRNASVVANVALLESGRKLADALFARPMAVKSS